MLKVAVRWRLARTNPVADVERPRLEQPEMTVLSESEVARLLTAFRELEQEADKNQRPWWRIGRRLVVVALGTGLRRGELLGLRWSDVELLEGRLSVRRAFVRGEVAHQRAARRGALSRSAREPSRRCRSSGARRTTKARANSSSGTPRSERRSTRASSPRASHGRRSPARRSSVRSGPGTISATQHSRTTPRQAIRRRISR